MKNLSKAVDFGKRNLLAGRKILVCCQNGKLTKSMPYAFLHFFLQLVELI